nr:acyl carrier protein [Legionella jordanis]
MFGDRIKKALIDAGLQTIPEDESVPLIQVGLDNLVLALLVVELEHEFKIQIPIIPLVKEKFSSISSIQNYLIELGVQ